MDSAWNAAGFKFHRKGVSCSSGISIHRTINDAHAPFHLVTAELVVQVHHACHIPFPHRAVRTADSLQLETGKFLQSGLYRSAVFSDDVGIVTYHLVTIKFECLLIVLDVFSDHSESTECIT